MIYRLAIFAESMGIYGAFLWFVVHGKPWTALFCLAGTATLAVLLTSSEIHPQ